MRLWGECAGRILRTSDPQGKDLGLALLRSELTVENVFILDLGDFCWAISQTRPWLVFADEMHCVDLVPVSSIGRLILVRSGGRDVVPDVSERVDISPTRTAVCSTPLHRLRPRTIR